VEKDRQRRGQHRRLERRLLEFLDRAGCCHHGTHGQGRPAPLISPQPTDEAASQDAPVIAEPIRPGREISRSGLAAPQRGQRVSSLPSCCRKTSKMQ
jgi:hypothetical protein